MILQSCWPSEWLSLGLLLETKGAAILFGPRDDLAVYREKAAPSYLCYFKTLTIGPVPEIESSTYRFAVKLSTHWTNPANGPSGGRFCSVALRKLAELYRLGWL